MLEDTTKILQNINPYANIFPMVEKDTKTAKTYRLSLEAFDRSTLSGRQIPALWWQEAIRKAHQG